MNQRHKFSHGYRVHERSLAVEKQQAERLESSVKSGKTSIEVELKIEVEDSKVVEFVAAHQNFLDMWGKSISITHIDISGSSDINSTSPEFDPVI
jgi:hypothetical protein